MLRNGFLTSCKKIGYTWDVLFTRSSNTFISNSISCDIKNSSFCIPFGPLLDASLCSLLILNILPDLCISSTGTFNFYWVLVILNPPDVFSSGNAAWNECLGIVSCQGFYLEFYCYSFKAISQSNSTFGPLYVCRAITNHHPIATKTTLKYTTKDQLKVCAVTVDAGGQNDQNQPIQLYAMAMIVKGTPILPSRKGPHSISLVGVVKRLCSMTAAATTKTE